MFCRISKKIKEEDLYEKTMEFNNLLKDNQL